MKNIVLWVIVSLFSFYCIPQDGGYFCKPQDFQLQEFETSRGKTEQFRCSEVAVGEYLAIKCLPFDEGAILLEKPSLCVHDGTSTWDWRYNGSPDYETGPNGEIIFQ